MLSPMICFTLCTLSGQEQKEVQVFPEFPLNGMVWFQRSKLNAHLKFPCLKQKYHFTAIVAKT